MGNNANKEKWIDEVLNSTNGMKHAHPRADLYDGVMHQINQNRSVKTVNISSTRWVAAAILLLTINASSAIYYSLRNNKTDQTALSNPIAGEIQSTSTYNY